jgi:hypothetical protein
MDTPEVARPHPPDRLREGDGTIITRVFQTFFDMPAIGGQAISIVALPPAACRIARR